MLITTFKTKAGETELITLLKEQDNNVDISSDYNVIEKSKGIFIFRKSQILGATKENTIVVSGNTISAGGLAEYIASILINRMISFQTEYHL